MLARLRRGSRQPRSKKRPRTHLLLDQSPFVSPPALQDRCALSVLLLPTTRWYQATIYKKFHGLPRLYLRAALLVALVAQEQSSLVENHQCAKRLALILQTSITKSLNVLCPQARKMVAHQSHWVEPPHFPKIVPRICVLLLQSLEWPHLCNLVLLLQVQCYRLCWRRGRRSRVSMQTISLTSQFCSPPKKTGFDHESKYRELLR